MPLAAMLAAFALATSAPAPPYDPSGDYAFEGSCPTIVAGYRGRLTIRRDGMFYALTWTIGEGRLSGRGLMTGRRMAVEFWDTAGTGGRGLMAMTRRGRHWRGGWAYFGYQETCTETWTPAR